MVHGVGYCSKEKIKFTVNDFAATTHFPDELSIYEPALQPHSALPDAILHVDQSSHWKVSHETVN